MLKKTYQSSKRAAGRWVIGAYARAGRSGSVTVGRANDGCYRRLVAGWKRMAERGKPSAVRACTTQSRRVRSGMPVKRLVAAKSPLNAANSRRTSSLWSGE